MLYSLGFPARSGAIPNTFDLLALLLTLSAGLAYLNYRVFRLPLTVGMLAGAAAIAAGLIALDAAAPHLGIKPLMRATVARIDFPATLLNGVLAFLLFAGALGVNSADLLARKWAILALATLGTILSTALVAGALFGVASLLHLAIPLPWCLVFGALISPTDPISVLDVLKRTGISPQLQATVAGESLFNDGVGVVLFTLLLGLATQAGGAGAALQGPAAIAGLFLLQAVGAGLLGLATGAAACLLIRHVDDYNVELMISLALASGTYSLAGALDMSGPIAVVAAGILFGAKGFELAMSDTTREHLGIFWRLIEEVLNALLFLLIGFVIVSIDLDRAALLAAVIMIPVVLAARWLSVAASSLPLHLGIAGRGGALLILTWGGLRGGLSLAMALSLPGAASKAPILTVTYGIVVFSILVQGMTLAPLARRVAREP